MNFLQKNETFIRLQEGDHLQADRAHLVRLNPKSQALATKFLDAQKERKEILYALLDHATEEEITANRAGKRIVTTNTGQKIAIEKKKNRKSNKRH